MYDDRPFEDPDLTEHEEQLLRWALEDLGEDRERELDEHERIHASTPTLPTERWPSLKRRFGEGTFGAFEGLDRAFIAYEMWRQYVLESPSVLLNKKACRAAFIAAAFMYETYQAMACDLDDEPRPPPNPGEPAHDGQDDQRADEPRGPETAEAHS